MTCKELQDLVTEKIVRPLSATLLREAVNASIRHFQRLYDWQCMDAFALALVLPAGMDWVQLPASYKRMHSRGIDTGAVYELIGGTTYRLIPSRVGDQEVTWAWLREQYPDRDEVGDIEYCAIFGRQRLVFNHCAARNYDLRVTCFCYLPDLGDDESNWFTEQLTDAVWRYAVGIALDDLEEHERAQLFMQRADALAIEAWSAEAFEGVTRTGPRSPVIRGR